MSGLAAGEYASASSKLGTSGIPSRDVKNLTRRAVTSGLTPTICDKIASDLNLEVNMARIGYARVSTLDQDLDVQLAKLKAEGCSIIRSEKVSGSNREGWPELATVLDFLREGDELVVARLDRLGRDTRDVLNLNASSAARSSRFSTLMSARAVKSAT
jgi:hypothetical protein